MSVNNNKKIINFLGKIMEVASGIKPAELVDIESDENITDYKRFLEIYRDMDNLEIRRNREKVSTEMLFYHKKALEETLTQKINLDALKYLGYPKDFDLNIYLKLFKIRMQSKEKPSEIGIFLGDRIARSIIVNNCYT